MAEALRNTRDIETFAGVECVGATSGDESDDISEYGWSGSTKPIRCIHRNVAKRSSNVEASDG
jgi:hypothetical protein